MKFQTEKAFCPTCKGTLLRLSHTCKMKRGASVLEGALTFVVIGSPSAWEMKEDEDSTHSAKTCVVGFIQSLHREWPQASFVIGKANKRLADAIDEKVSVDICELDKELQGIADDIHASILVAGGRQAAEEAALVQEKPMFHVAVEKLAPYAKIANYDELAKKDTFVPLGCIATTSGDRSWDVAAAVEKVKRKMLMVNAEQEHMEEPPVKSMRTRSPSTAPQ